MPKNKDLIKSAKIRKAPDKKSAMEKGADKLKKKTDDVIVDYVTTPLSQAGYPGVGAALGAAGSAAADFLIPSSPVELLPIGKILSKAKKGIKGLSQLTDMLAQNPKKLDRIKETIDKGDITYKERAGLQKIYDEATKKVNEKKAGAVKRDVQRGLEQFADDPQGKKAIGQVSTKAGQDAKSKTKKLLEEAQQPKSHIYRIGKKKK